MGFLVQNLHIFAFFEKEIVLHIKLMPIFASSKRSK